MILAFESGSLSHKKLFFLKDPIPLLSYYAFVDHCKISFHVMCDASVLKPMVPILNISPIFRFP